MCWSADHVAVSVDHRFCCLPFQLFGEVLVYLCLYALCRQICWMEWVQFSVRCGPMRYLVQVPECFCQNFLPIHCVWWSTSAFFCYFFVCSWAVWWRTSVSFCYICLSMSCLVENQCVFLLHLSVHELSYGDPVCFSAIFVCPWAVWWSTSVFLPHLFAHELFGRIPVCLSVRLFCPHAVWLSASVSICKSCLFMSCLVEYPYIFP